MTSNSCSTHDRLCQRQRSSTVGKAIQRLQRLVHAIADEADVQRIDIQLRSSFFKPDRNQVYSYSPASESFLLSRWNTRNNDVGPASNRRRKTGRPRVSVQDVATGELAYKPVQLTTLRPPTPLVKIGLGSQSLLATPGHPFWVVGEGWRTAKHLKVGTLVHAVSGAILIESLEEIAPQEVYNFVVSEFHNYFVGESRLLVHDNSPIEETSSACPGLTMEKP